MECPQDGDRIASHSEMQGAAREPKFESRIQREVSGKGGSQRRWPAPDWKGKGGEGEERRWQERSNQRREGRTERTMAKVGADPTIPVIASTSCHSMPCSSSQFSGVIHDLILGSVSSSFGSLVSDFCESQGESTARGNRLR